MRMEKVNQQLKREISLILLEELADPRIALVIILNVDTSRDLKNAKVSFSALGNAQQIAHAQQGLESAKGFIRRLISQRLTIRCTPELIFILDRSVEYSDRIEKTLQEIQDGSKENHSGH